MCDGETKNHMETKHPEVLSENFSSISLYMFTCRDRNLNVKNYDTVYIELPISDVYRKLKLFS